MTSQELIKSGTITGVDQSQENNGEIDLQLLKIERIFGIGLIHKEGKDRELDLKEVQVESLIISQEKLTHPEEGTEYTPIESSGWKLEPGNYKATFKQGCIITDDIMLVARHKNNLFLKGGHMHNLILNKGRVEENLETMIVITHPIEIEYLSSIAEIFLHIPNII